MTFNPNSSTGVAATPRDHARPASRNTSEGVTREQLAAAWRVMEARSTMPRRIASPAEVARRS